MYGSEQLGRGFLDSFMEKLLSPEPLKNPPWPAAGADCCSAVEQPMLRQRAPDYGAQGPQLLLPTTPSLLPPNSLISPHAMTNLTSQPF